MQPRLRPDLCTSPLFLASLAVLVVNDWLLKRAFPGAVTGKLSDFAGLIALTLFCLAFFPRHGRIVAALIAIAFVLWKLPLAQPAIDWWNRHAPFRVGRTVDVTDLIALAVIPLALFHARDREARPHRPVATVALMACAAFAFVATSYRTTFDFDTEYVYAGNPAALWNRLAELGITVYPVPGTSDTNEYDLRIPATICLDSIEAGVVVHARGNATHVRLQRLTHRCPESEGGKAELQRVFQTAVVQPLTLKRIR